MTTLRHAVDGAPEPRPPLLQQIHEVECYALTAEARVRIGAERLGSGKPLPADIGGTVSGAPALRAAVETCAGCATTGRQSGPQ